MCDGTFTRGKFFAPCMLNVKIDSDPPRISAVPSP
jgi:hypothetical protein